MTLIRRAQSNVPAFNYLLENFLSEANYSGQNHTRTLPAVNISEDTEGFKVEVAAPGLKKENFSLNLDHNRLTISARSENNSTEKSEKYTRREFNFTSFQRTFTLPQSVNADQIEAKYNEGVLTLSIPKREEAKEKPARQIEIA